MCSRLSRLCSILSVIKDALHIFLTKSRWQHSNVSLSLVSQRPTAQKKGKINLSKLTSTRIKSAINCRTGFEKCNNLEKCEFSYIYCTYICLQVTFFLYFKPSFYSCELISRPYLNNRRAAFVSDLSHCPDPLLFKFLFKAALIALYIVLLSVRWLL